MARLGNSLSDNVSVGIAPNVKDEFEKIIYQVSIPIDANSVNEYVYIAPKAVTLLSATECHVTAGSSGTLMLENTGTTGAIASTGNTDLLTSAFDLTATAPINYAGTLSTASGALTITAGERIALNFVSTGYASLVGGVVSISLQPDA